MVDFFIRGCPQGPDDFPSYDVLEDISGVAGGEVEVALGVSLFDVQPGVQMASLLEFSALVDIKVQEGGIFLRIIQGELDAGHLTVEVVEKFSQLLHPSSPQHQHIIKKPEPSLWWCSPPIVPGLSLPRQPGKGWQRGGGGGGGAHLVPMATPLTWSKKLSWKAKWFSLITTLSESLKKFLYSEDLDVAGYVWTTLCRTSSIPAPWGMDR